MSNSRKVVPQSDSARGYPSPSTRRPRQNVTMPSPIAGGGGDRRPAEPKSAFAAMMEAFLDTPSPADVLTSEQLAMAVAPRGAVDPLDILLEKYTAELAANAEDIKQLKAQGGEDSFPTQDEAQFNTAPQRLTVAMDRIVADFGGADSVPPPPSPPRPDADPAIHDLSNLCHQLYSLTKDMLKKAEVASEIQHRHPRTLSGRNGGEAGTEHS